MHKTVVVSKDGYSDYSSIQEAINSIRVHPLEPVTIFIKNGVYLEKVLIPDNKTNIRLLGESKERTIISYGDYANMMDAANCRLGTFQTPVVTALPDNFCMENLTIENTAGYGEEIGQALALYVAGDRTSFKNIRILGNQDTLYTSRGRQLFQKCYIAGHVDFIFGASTAVFDHCEIHSLRKGYITASATPREKMLGYVFLDCNLTGSTEKNCVFLGRPWRPYAHTVFIRTWMGNHIKREGWDNWRNEENESTARYGEYGSSGPGALSTGRVQWARNLSRSEVAKLTIKEIFPDYTNWLWEEIERS